MKTIFIKIILCTALIFNLSCSKDDDNAPVDNTKVVWNLRNVNGGFPGVDVDYQTGDVIWSFDAQTNILEVQSTIINNGPQSAYLPLQTRNYNYSIARSNGTDYLSIDGQSVFPNGEYGSFTITATGDLIIDQGQGSQGTASDVFILSFE